MGSTNDLKTLDLEDGSIIVVGSKQVQVLDLVTESNIAEPAKSTVVSRPLPPRKRPKMLYSTLDALIMPEPDIDHQVNKFK